MITISNEALETVSGGTWYGEAYQAAKAGLAGVGATTVSSALFSATKGAGTAAQKMATDAHVAANMRKWAPIGLAAGLAAYGAEKIYEANK